MTNSEIAKILRNIGLILEMKGENHFRFLAYEKAADTILNTTRDLKDIYQDRGLKGLEELENIGQAIALKIEELIKTGKLAYYKEITKEIPEKVLEMTEIPGIGAKTAYALFKDLNIDSIPKLAKAARDHKIQQLPHFKARSEENILRGIAQYRVGRKERTRMLLPKSEAIAREIVSYIKKSKLAEKIAIVGSLRRMKETIGDIDLVAAASKPKQVIDHLAKADFVKERLLKGTTKLSFIHRDDARVDLEVLLKKDYGSLLHHLTGSKEHNVALRTWATERGLKISEYGITDLKRKKLHHFFDEKSFFKFLGMQYIEPELREDSGEIEAALDNKLPKIIGYRDIKGDLHTHTDNSDGANTIEEMIVSAQKMKYEYYGISDHTIGLGVVRGLDEKTLLKYKSSIYKIAKKFKGIRVLAGAEVNIKADGKLDIANAVLAKIDYVIASVHSAFNQEKSVMTKRIISAIKNPQVNIIGHPSGRLLGERQPYEVDWPEVFKAAAKYGVALEIDAYPNRLDLKDLLIREAISFGCKLVIDTDSHSITGFDKMRYGIAMARRGWATKDNIVNTWSLVKLVKWLNA